MGFHGLELEVRRCAGAKAVRVVHGPGQVISGHDHAWACITIPVIGSGLERFDGGEARMGGPSGILHPAKRGHSDSIGRTGLETFSIQFDPAWLGADLRRPLDRSIAWSGGKAAAKAVRLIAAWQQARPSERHLKLATADFIAEALAAAPLEAPAWLKTLRAEVRSGDGLSTTRLARRLDLHPAYLARCYRYFCGEGLADARRRRRVEEAVDHLRRTDQPLAEVAIAAGFSDQSHMTRNFAQLLGRTPLQVRQERALLGM